MLTYAGIAKRQKATIGIRLKWERAVARKEGDCAKKLQAIRRSPTASSSPYLSSFLNRH
jgi:hypothetical protein